MATFADAEQARKAVEALGRAGIESDEMSVGGRPMKAAGTDADTRQRDIGATTDLATHAGAGGIIGSLVGGLGAVVVLLILGTEPSHWGFWIATLGGLIAGGAVGGMVGGVRKLPLTQEWELTYDDDATSSDGRVRVRVHASDEDQLERARKVLASEKPIDVERVDARGQTSP